MKTRIKKDKEKYSNENRSRRGRKQKGNVFRALSRGRLVSGRAAAVPGAHTATGVVQLNRAEI